MKILTFTNLYPNAVQIRHGVFVENRLRHLIEGSDYECRVVAPVPWFPFRHKVFGEYGTFAQVPHIDKRHNIEIIHPRYPSIPKIGMNTAPWLLYVSMKRVLRQLIRTDFDFDLIDAHYFYPDGVAAIYLGKYFNKPVVITARGSDLTQLPNFRYPGKMIKWAAKQAAGLVTVSQALKDSLIGMGVPSDKISVLRNGVDLDMFKQPTDRTTLRSNMGISGFTLICVGNLIPLKGYDLVIQSMVELPNVNLMIAGEGSEGNYLRKLANKLGVANRVKFLGTVPHEHLCDYYGAADLLVLASSREGWPNVLLEAMACGTPVIATRVWGIPEIVAKPEAGLLIQSRNAKEIAESVLKIMNQYPGRGVTRKYAEKFSWDATTLGQIELFEGVIGT